MSIAGLIRRLVKGSPLTAAEHDGNLNALEAAIEAVETTPGPQGPAGPKGDTGSAGATGPAGAAATITVGAVATGAPGSSVSVVNSGTSSAAVLDITIPRGDKGDAGDAGPAGAAGATGPAGAAATISVGTVTTGAAGSSATVTNAGTSSAAVLNFTIPAGAAGPQGPAGATGPAGTTTWAGITDKPSTFPPEAHASSHQTGGADEVGTVYASPAQITANTNNWAIGTADVFFVSSNAARDVTGFVITRPALVINTGSHAITVKHDSASSDTGSRVLVPWAGDYVLAAGGGAILLVPHASSGKLRAV